MLIVWLRMPGCVRGYHAGEPALFLPSATSWGLIANRSAVNGRFIELATRRRVVDLRSALRTNACLERVQEFSARDYYSEMDGPASRPAGLYLRSRRSVRQRQSTGLNVRAALHHPVLS